MATQSEKLVVILALVLALAIVLRVANGLSETTFTLCGMTKDGLMSCQESVDKWNPRPPSEACCTAISKAKLQCLCSLKDSPLLKMFNVDPDRAMALPRTCSPDAPSFHCQ